MITVVSALAAASVLAALAPRHPGAVARRLPRAQEHRLSLPVVIGRALRRRWPEAVALVDGIMGGRPFSDAGLGMAVTAVAGGALLMLPFGRRGVWFMPVAGLGAWSAAMRFRATRSARVGHGIRTVVADAIDLISVTAGAGLNVFRSLEVVAAAVAPPLSTEVRRVVDGVRCGRPLRYGLGDLARRIPVPEVALLARTLEVAHRQGLPLATTIETAADEIRTAQRQDAEEAARAAPVKMLFPLAFLILPSFLLLAAVPLVVPALRQVPL